MKLSTFKQENHGKTWEMTRGFGHVVSYFLLVYREFSLWQLETNTSRHKIGISPSLESHFASVWPQAWKAKGHVNRRYENSQDD